MAQGQAGANAVAVVAIGRNRGKLAISPVSCPGLSDKRRFRINGGSIRNDIFESNPGLPGKMVKI